MNPNNKDSISLNKHISEHGLCSRREADAIIDQGRVKINGLVAKKGNRVALGDVVTMDDKVISNKPESVYLAYNKPVGIVCTTDPRESDNIIQAIDYPERLFPIGRLDKPSQGLILLTNDGDIVNKILRAGNKHEKEYIVTVDRKITRDFINGMSRGVPILETITKKCKVERINDYTFRIILIQGLNRQIRRMCGYFEYEVKRLERIRIMNINLDGISEGHWRHLSPQEMTEINEQVKDSKKESGVSFDFKKLKS